MKYIVLLIALSSLMSQTIFTEFKKTQNTFNQNESKNIEMNKFNLALRAGLELSALYAMGEWGFHLGNGENWAAAILIPVSAAAIWGIFAVENDPSRSGNTIVNTPGWARFALEIGFFAFATYALADLDHNNYAYIMTGATVIHYSFSLDRIKWLLKQ